MTIVSGGSDGKIPGQIEWQPEPVHLGGQTTANHWVTVVATSNGLTASQRYRITLRQENHAPVLIRDWPVELTLGQTYRHDFRASDPDRDPLVFTLDDAPDGMQMDRYGRVTWTPGPADLTAGTDGHRVEVTVTDPYGAFDNQTYFIKVVSDTRPPSVDLRVWPGTTVDLGRELTILVSAVDNVAVQTVTLTVVGPGFSETLALDASGTARYTPSRLVPFQLVARATDAAGNSASASETIFVTDPHAERGAAHPATGAAAGGRA
jgi:large repetitive protein